MRVPVDIDDILGQVDTISESIDEREWSSIRIVITPGSSDPLYIIKRVTTDRRGTHNEFLVVEQIEIPDYDIFFLEDYFACSPKDRMIDQRHIRIDVQSVSEVSSWLDDRPPISRTGDYIVIWITKDVNKDRYTTLELGRRQDRLRPDLLSPRFTFEDFITLVQTFGAALPSTWRTSEHLGKLHTRLKYHISRSFGTVDPAYRFLTVSEKITPWLMLSWSLGGLEDGMVEQIGIHKVPKSKGISLDHRHIVIRVRQKDGSLAEFTLLGWRNVWRAPHMWYTFGCPTPADLSWLSLEPVRFSTVVDGWYTLHDNTRALTESNGDKKALKRAGINLDEVFVGAAFWMSAIPVLGRFLMGECFRGKSTGGPRASWRGIVSGWRRSISLH